MQNHNELFRIDFTTSTFTYTPLGGPTPFDYNALGFNHQDGYLYAITNGDLPHRVVRFGANGAWEDLGPVAGLNDADYLAGAFLADGRYVVANGNGATIVVLDVGTGSPTVVSVASYAPVARMRDFAVSPVNGVLYGFDEFGQRMASINPTTGEVAPFGVARPAGQEIGLIGSAWFDAFGRFYGYGQPPGGTGMQTVFYQADVGAGGRGQLGELVQVSTGPQTGASDGASCPFGVRMEKTVNPGSVQAGNTVTYSYSITNRSAVVQHPRFTDTMDGGRTFVPGTLATSLGGSANAYGGTNTLDISGLSINTGQTATITVQALVPATAAAGTVFNQARLTGLSAPAPVTVLSDYPGAPGPEDPTPLQITAAATADVAVAKSGPAQVAANAVFTYTIAVTNNGPSPAAAVTATDTLPAGFTFVSATGGGTQSTPGVVTWSLGDMAASASVLRTVTVRAPAEAATGTNRVTAAAANDTNPVNNQAQATTVVTASADLSIMKTGPAEVDAAQNVAYTITVTNHGPSTATGVTAIDTLPAGFSFVSASDGGAQAPVGVVTWSLTPISPGASRTVNVVAKAAHEGEAAVNRAHVDSASFDPNGGNDDDAVTTRVIPVADIVLDKSAPETVEAGENLTYTLVVTNNGPSTAMKVVVTDQLPEGFLFLSADNGGGQTAPGVVTWDLGTMAAGSQRTLQVTATAPLRVFTATNQATGRSDTIDRRGDNNVDRVDTRVVDTTPPVTACAATTNPSGGNVPSAGNNPRSGQNPDGFYVLMAVDGVDPSPNVMLTDTASGKVFGPFPSGTKIKLTQAQGAPPSQKKGAGDIDWHITFNGDAEVRGIDVSGNVSEPVSCLVPPNPK